MAIRFDKKFNAEIRREIGKVNKKFARARKLGYEKVPRNISVKDIKKEFSSRYATRRELRRAIIGFQKANISDLSKVVELETGSRVSLFTLKSTEQKRIRLYRMTNRLIKKAEAKEYNINTPFVKSELDRLYNQREMLKRGSRASESQMRAINEMYSRIYSSKKKSAFEDALYSTMEDQIKRSNLSRSQQQALLTKIRNTDADVLIEINKNEKAFANILDRYKNKNDYTAYDEKMFQKAYDDIYDDFEQWVEKYSQ